MGQTWHLQCDPGCHLVGTGELTCVGVPDPFHHVAIWDTFQGSSKCEKSKQLSPKISEVLYVFLRGIGLQAIASKRFSTNCNLWKDIREFIIIRYTHMLWTGEYQYVNIYKI